MVNLDSKQKGNLTELQSIVAFYELGYQVSIPYGENSRYDFIADINGKLIKVQCKTARKIDDGVIEFSCRSCRSNTQSSIERRYTKNEIDFFCTYWDGQCYLIPIEETSTSKKLRFVAPKNGQKVGISYAKDYELSNQLERIKG